MSREWKPGDVAMVKNDYGAWNLCIRTLVAGRGWVWRPGCADIFYADDIVQGVRPLVVVDPEDVDAVYRLDDLYRAAKSRGAGAYGWMQQALREFASPQPPKPDEPTGLGAVVEDSAGELWVHVGPGDSFHVWAPENGNRVATSYEAIDAVRVLSEGIQP